MQNYKLTIEYDGTNFNGWQTQPDKRTIQNEIEKALQAIYQSELKVVGAGRTDTGVHAKGQVATFMGPNKIPLNKIPKALNANLPADISIVNIEEVPNDFHPRFQAQWKIYQYQLQFGYTRPTISRNFRYHHKSKLDVNLLHAAKELLIGTHDFKAFSCLRGTETGSEDYTRTIHDISIVTMQNEINIIYKGNGFLYKMVRMLTGSLLLVASGKMSLAELNQFIQNGAIGSAGPALPGFGLVLLEVIY